MPILSQMLHDADLYSPKKKKNVSIEQVAVLEIEPADTVFESLFC
jgi:hypothetical protein